MQRINSSSWRIQYSPTPRLGDAMKAIAMAELRKAEDAAIEAALAIRRKDPNSERSRQLVVPKRHPLSAVEKLMCPLGGACELCDVIQGIPEIVQLMNGFATVKPPSVITWWNSVKAEHMGKCSCSIVLCSKYEYKILMIYIVLWFFIPGMTNETELTTVRRSFPLVPYAIELLRSSTA